MKLVKTFYTNSDFFNRYARLASILTIVAFMGQIISASTESVIIYTSAYSSFAKLIPGYADLLAKIVTVFGVITIELGLIVLLPLSVCAFLYRRFTGNDLIITLFIIPCTLFLMCIGTFMSFKGSKEIVKKGFGEVEIQTTDKAQKEKDETLKTINSEHSLLLSQLTRTKEESLANLNEINTSKIESMKTSLSQIKAKEKRTGKKYTTQKDRLIKQIAKEKELYTMQKGKVISDFQEALNKAQNKKELSTDKALSKYESEVNDIKGKNQKATIKHQNSINNYGSLLGYLNIVLVFILLVSNIIKETHKKGSGIKDKVIVGDSYFMENVLSSFIKALFSLIESKARSVVNWIEDKTPKTPQVYIAPKVFDRSEIEPEVIRHSIGFNRHEKTTKQTTKKAKPKKKESKGYEYVNTIKDLNKYKKRLASHKQKALYQKRSKGYILPRTQDAIKNNSSKVDQLEDKLSKLI